MIGIPIDLLSLAAVRLEAYFGDLYLGVATGSFWEHEGRQHLLTNWHVVTGLHAETGQPLHPHGSLPDRLKVVSHHPERLGWWKVAMIELFDDQGRPDWYEHPVHGHNVDIAAIPLEPTDDITFYPVNNPEEYTDFPLRVGQDVFVIGFPRGVTGHGYFPVWKRGTIASEPGIDLDNLPRMLIDAATREGLSGAPVVAQFTGIHRFDQDKVTDQDWIGTGRRLAGIYSSRVPGDAFDAQLGHVWKVSAVEEVIVAKHRPK